MIDELKKFIKSTSSKVGHRYDFGIFDTLVPSFCLLAEKINKEENFKAILDVIVDQFPEITYSSVDNCGNTVYHLCSIYGNVALFNYFKKRREFRLAFLKIKNRYMMTPVVLAIKCKNNDILAAILELELEDNSKGFGINDKMKEYGKELLLIAAVSCNDRALDMLFDKQADKVAKLSRKTFKQASKYLIHGLVSDVMAEPYCDKYYQGDLPDEIVVCLKKHSIANRPLFSSKEDIERALNYLESYPYKKFYYDFLSRVSELNTLILDKETTLKKYKIFRATDPLAAHFNELRTQKQNFEKKRINFFGNALYDKQKSLNKIVKNPDKFDQIRSELLVISHRFKDFFNRAEQIMSSRELE